MAARALSVCYISAVRALLALDTSTHAASVAVVAEDARVLAERASRVSTHSETLLVLIDETLAEAALPLAGLAAVACGAGPGSFTGLRIGLATAKGLCFGSGHPLVMVPSLAALAAEAPVGAVALACVDARKGEVFAAAYRDGRAIADEAAYRPEAVAPAASALQASHPDARIVLVGDAVVRYPALASAGEWLVRTPAAAQVGRLAWQRVARGESDDLDAASPRYVRPPEITVKRKKH